MVRFGRSVEEGFLPVYSVDTEKEAKELVVACCKRDLNHEFISSELEQDQTLENLVAFSDRLHTAYRRMKKGRVR